MPTCAITHRVFQIIRKWNRKKLMLKDNNFTPHMIVHVYHRNLCCVEDRMSIHHMVRTVLVRSEYPCDPEQTAPVDEWLRTLNRTSSRRCVFVASWCHVWDKPSSACGWSGGWIVKMIRGKGNSLRYWGTMYMYILIYAIYSKVMYIQVQHLSRKSRL